MNIFKEIVELQFRFNSKIHQQWYRQNYSWDSAIIVESGELLESYGYKWWKKQKTDINNVKVEAIDLLHFVISDIIQRFYNEWEYIDIDIVSNEFKNDFTMINCKVNNSMLELINQLNTETSKRFVTMKLIFKLLNMTNKEIYLAYITKNCLNELRQKYGYNDNLYIKNWNGKEDNVIAYKIASQYKAEELTYERLLIHLEVYYKMKVLKEES